MATTSFTALRRFAGFAITLMVFALWQPGHAMGQGTPLVTATSAIGLSHPSGWGAIQQTAIDSYGDWVVVDYANGAVYEFPAGGGAAVTLFPANGLGGGYENPAVAIDPNNNLYLGANWNNALAMFPWDPVQKTWTAWQPTIGSSGSPTGWPTLSTLATVGAATPSTTMCTNSGKTNSPNCFAQYSIQDLTGSSIIGNYGYFQPWGIAIGNNNNLIIGLQGGNNGIDVQSLAITGAWANPTVAGWNWVPATGLTARAISIAQDPWGNVYLVEDSGGLPGVLEIPGTATNGQYQTSGKVNGDATLARVDPNLPAVTGVITDAQGNLYISDSQLGVVMVPNSAGTPQTSSAVLLTPVPAQGEVAIDSAHGFMYVPTHQKQTNGEADVAQLGLGSAELGSSAVGTTAGTTANVNFAFNGSATPASFVIVEDGVKTPDFAITGGTCTTGTAYAANAGCLENVSFTPTSVGAVSARLLMLDAKNNILASMLLHGTGTGANIQAAPALESAIGSGFQNPSQVAVDAAGNIYVADPGAGKVQMYAPGSSKAVSIGTGLTAPSGVAVDGAGDVFIADSAQGTVFEVPFGASGLNAAGQTTVVSGLGTGLSLAVGPRGTLYVADPTNKQVVKVTNIGASISSNLGQTETKLSGFTNPTAVAVDASSNLYVIDNNNLFELTGGAGAATTLLNNLSGATGVSVDPSGAVYISSTGGTVRIPYVSGALVPANETAIAASVTAPSSVALDRWGNVYLVDSTALNVHVVAVNGSLALPTPSSLTSSTTETATIVNSGNAPLSVTAYTSTNAVDFTGADGTCIASSPVAAGGTCSVVVTFSPGAGEQGALSGQIGITSNAQNSPIVLNATGTGLALSASTTTPTVGSGPQVINTPLTVVVAPKSGSGAPSGQVTVSYPTWVVQSINGTPTIVPQTAKVTANLDATGKATFALAPVLAGNDTFTVNYSGDRVYGRSSGTTTVAVAKSAITGIGLPVFPDPTDIDLPFVAAGTGSGTTPYDGSEQPFQYNFIMKVNTAAGVPTGTITVMDNVTSCPPGTSATGVGAAACILAGYATPGGYSGVACPNSSGSGVLTIANAGTVTGAQASFPASCLWFVPQGISYSPVMFTHYINPVYSGDANFLSLTGSTATVLQSVRGPMLQITQSGNAASQTAAPTLTITQGSTATLNLTLTSMLGYGIAGKNAQLNASNFPISLSCDNLPPHTQCVFTYPNPDPSLATATDINCPSGATTTQIANGTAQCTPAQVTLTLYTNVSAGTTTSRNMTATSLTLASIFGFGMLGLFFRRRAFEKGRMMLMVILMVVGGALAVSITACNTTTLSSGSTLSTPAGTYAMTVTADEAGTLCVSEPGGAGDNCIVSGSGSTSNNGVLVYGTQNQVSLPFYVNVTVQ